VLLRRFSCRLRGAPEGSQKAGDRMSECELVSIVWHRNAPQVIQRIYASGPLERVSGTRTQAEEMAENEGFILVPTPVHLVKWIKQVP
jgi:hypothetical protein